MPSPARSPRRSRRARLAIGVGALLFALAFGLAFAPPFSPPALAAGDETSVRAAESGLGAYAESAIERLRGAPPILFFSAFVVATFLPFPIVLFYLVAGAVYGIPASLAWIAGSLVVSNLAIHTAARSILRPAFEALVARRGQRIPTFDSALDEALFIMLIRLTPGIPYFFQNLILAVARLDLVRFVVLSVAIQMIYVTGFVVLGRAALGGEYGWALAGLALIVALAIGARVASKRRRDRGDP